jgi:CheY-like chemotaxis protein
VTLIVQDEFLIRMATAEAIKDFGFEVIEAANADAVIIILESRSDIRVVTDIHMAGSVDGAKLALAIRNRRPPVRIIATSGRIAVETLDLPAGTLSYLSHTAQSILRGGCTALLMLERVGMSQYGSKAFMVLVGVTVEKGWPQRERFVVGCLSLEQAAWACTRPKIPECFRTRSLDGTPIMGKVRSGAGSSRLPA